MIRRALVLALGLSLVPSLVPVARAADPAAAAPAFALADSLRLDPAVRTGVLPNGLRYFIRHNGRPEARVSLRLALAAGSTAEADDQRGFAHFCEHMNFNGSTHFKPEEMVAYLQSIGMRFGSDANAYTSFDQTIYMLEVPTDRDTLLDRGLLALADFAGGATLSDAEIQQERGVVLEEWRLGRGATDRMQRQQLPIVYRGSRYAERLPIGKPEIIEKGSADRVRAFYHDWYTPDRMAVIAVGDIDPARMDSLVRVHFGPLQRPAQALVAPVSDLPAHDSTLFAIATDKEAAGTQVGLFYKHPRRPFGTIGDFRADMVHGLFLAMFNQRFTEIAHRADAPFLNASTFAFPFGQVSEIAGAFASVADGGSEKGLAALLQEIERVRRHGFLAIELQRAKDQSRSRMERAYAERDKSESEGFASEYVQYALTGEPAPGIEVEHRLAGALLDGITLAEVNAVATRLYHEHSRVVIASAPEKAGSTPPSEPALRAVLAAATQVVPGPWEDRGAGRPLMAQQPRPGTVKSRRSIDALGVTVLRFSNGVEVWLKPTDFKADEIVLASYALGGLSVADTARYSDLVWTSTVVNDAGVGGFTSTELQKLLAGRIVQTSTFIGGYTHGIRASTRPADLETALQLVHLTFTRPTEDPAAFAALQKRLLNYMIDRRNTPEQAFADTAAVVNSGRFYMNLPGTPEGVEHATLGPMLAYHRERFANAADFTFFMAGAFQVDSVAPLLARYLGSLPSKGRRTSAFVARGPRYPYGVRTVIVRKGVEPKASVRITFFANTPIEELDQHRARALSSILTDRLRESLRELMSGTYSASASFGSLSPLPGYATMSVAFGCAPGRVDSLVAATLAEVRRLREEGPTPSDVQKDQEIERRELEVSMKQNGYWTASLQTTHMLGWDPLRITRRRERIDLLTPDNLRESARRYLPLDRYTVVILLPEEGAGAGAAKP